MKKESKNWGLELNMAYKTWLGVAVGGFAGTLSRYGLSQVPMTWSGFTLNILAINLLGAFLLASFLEISLDRLRLSTPLRTGISTGFLGAFTTFSGLCSEAFSLNMYEGTGAAGFYLVLSLTGGICAAFLGVTCARIMIRSGGSHE